MSEANVDSDGLQAACEALLREIAGYPITPERMAAALPLIKEMLRAIRTLDEVDVASVEPMTSFRALS